MAKFILTLLLNAPETFYLCTRERTRPHCISRYSHASFFSEGKKCRPSVIVGARNGWPENSLSAGEFKSCPLPPYQLTSRSRQRISQSLDILERKLLGVTLYALFKKFGLTL